MHIHGCKTNWLIYVVPGGTCIQLNVFTVIINVIGKVEVTPLTAISPEWSMASLYITLTGMTALALSNTTRYQYETNNINATER